MDYNVNVTLVLKKLDAAWHQNTPCLNERRNHLVILYNIYISQSICLTVS